MAVTGWVTLISSTQTRELQFVPIMLLCKELNFPDIFLWDKYWIIYCVWMLFVCLVYVLSSYCTFYYCLLSCDHSFMNKCLTFHLQKTLLHLFLQWVYLNNHHFRLSFLTDVSKKIQFMICHSASLLIIVYNWIFCVFIMSRYSHSYTCFIS